MPVLPFFLCRCAFVLLFFFSPGIPTFLGGMSRGMLGRNNKYHIRQNRRVALRQADVVILAGAVCDFRLDYGRSLSPKSKIIACVACSWFWFA